jgi:hypothetical protein
MEKLLVVIFDDEKKAYEGSRALSALDAEGSISIHSEAVVSKNADGKLSIKEADGDFPIRTLGGTALGSLAGLLGGPVGFGQRRRWTQKCAPSSSMPRKHRVTPRRPWKRGPMSFVTSSRSAQPTARVDPQVATIKRGSREEIRRRERFSRRETQCARTFKEAPWTARRN